MRARVRFACWSGAYRAARSRPRGPRRSACSRSARRFDQPIFATSPPGDPRLFVVERPGFIQVLHDGTVSQFLDIHTRTTNDGERGLLSMAFDPNYSSNGLFYVYYTGDGTNSGGALGDIHIDEFHVSSNPNVADPASRRTVWTFSPQRHQPQRRAAPVRPGRLPLHHDRRQREQRQRAVARATPTGRSSGSIRTARATAPTAFRRRTHSRASPGRRQEIWGLGPAQPVPLLLRPPHRGPDHRRRRRGVARGDRLLAGIGGRWPRRELRLALPRGSQRRPGRLRRLIRQPGLRLPAQRVRAGTLRTAARSSAATSTAAARRPRSQAATCTPTSAPRSCVRSSSACRSRAAIAPRAPSMRW